jgi:hypothetical protein
MRCRRLILICDATLLLLTSCAAAGTCWTALAESAPPALISALDGALLMCVEAVTGLLAGLTAAAVHTEGAVVPLWIAAVTCIGPHALSPLSNSGVRVSAFNAVAVSVHQCSQQSNQTHTLCTA